MRIVTDMDTPPTAYISYVQAAYQYNTSVRYLSDLVQAGTLTRFTSSKDRRKVLLDTQELTEYFNGQDTPVTHPTAA